MFSCSEEASTTTTTTTTTMDGDDDDDDDGRRSTWKVGRARWERSLHSKQSLLLLYRFMPRCMVAGIVCFVAVNTRASIDDGSFGGEK